MRTRRWVQAGLLLTLGLYFLDNMVTGKISFYVNERFIWLSWFGTGLMLIMGVISVVDLLREPVASAAVETAPAAAHEGHDHEHEAHDHEHIHDDEADHHHHHAPSWPILGVIAVPLILGLIVPAKPLGAAALSTNGLTTSFSGSSSATELTVAPQDRNVLDWVRDFASADDLKQFAGQQADVIGFVYRDTRLDPKIQMMVARFAISCCVADASAIGLIVQTKNADTYVQDGWVHVKGSFQVQDLNGEKAPILVADTIENTTQPAHPYLYP